MANRKTLPLQLVSLVRHADAGSRERFVGEDELRPLSRRGRREAEAIGRRLAEHPGQLVSSPALRCLETLAPLSARLRQAMTPFPALAEGKSPKAALHFLLGQLDGSDGLIACSHGDVMTGIVKLIEGTDAKVTGPVNLDKASITELSVLGGRVVAVAFVPPPER